jgi:hypothetical protein
VKQATAGPRPRSGAHRAATQRAPASRAPRRVSGPARPTRPTPRPVAAPAGAQGIPRRGTTSAFERILSAADHRVVDRLLRSRLWIILVGALLGGIVAMQVSLLKLNSGISRAVETSTTLERQNAVLEASIARLSSPDRIESGAATLGMVMPPAGDVGYLRAGPEDAGEAVRRMQPPSEEAAALLANGGIVPGSLAAPEVASAAPAVDPAAPVAEVAPAAPAEPVVTPTPDPAAAAATAGLP